MKLIIHKGKHRPSIIQRLQQFGLFFGEKIVRKVVFYSDCRYNLNGIEDDEDVNKLFGIGYFPSHHKNSARFGWFYDNDSGKIVLMAYCYVRGKQVIEKLCEVDLNRLYRCVLNVFDDSYFFWVHDENFKLLAMKSVEHNGVGKIAFKLGLYFGGNQKAPHEMTIKIERP